MRESKLVRNTVVLNWKGLTVTLVKEEQLGASGRSIGMSAENPRWVILAACLASSLCHRACPFVSQISGGAWICPRALYILARERRSAWEPESRP
jgi:hypothetical protein